MKNFRLEKVSQLLGQSVTLKDPHSDLSLEAVVKSVDENRINGDQFESFSVILEHAGELNVSQAILQFSHPEIGEEDLLVTPLSETEIQIVVNRS